MASNHMPLEDTLDAILYELQQLNMTRSGSVSSVEVKTSTRGTDITVKAYEGSDVESAGNAAVAEYRRVQALLEGKVMDGMQAEVERIGREKIAQYHPSIPLGDLYPDPSAR